MLFVGGAKTDSSFVVVVVSFSFSFFLLLPLSFFLVPSFFLDRATVIRIITGGAMKRGWQSKMTEIVVASKAEVIFDGDDIVPYQIDRGKHSVGVVGVVGLVWLGGWLGGRSLSFIH
jgi:hypothetical protein